MATRGMGPSDHNKPAPGRPTAPTVVSGPDSRPGRTIFATGNAQRHYTEQAYEGEVYGQGGMDDPNPSTGD